MLGARVLDDSFIKQIVIARRFAGGGIKRSYEGGRLVLCLGLPRRQLRGAETMASMHDSARSKTTVYAAIELSKKSWVVGVAPPDRDRPSIHRIAGGNLADLVGRLREAAGRSNGSWSATRRGMTVFGWRVHWKIGIDCRVLDPASIQVNRRARRVKTDRIDLFALLRALIATDRGERHVCAVVRVPTVEEEDARRSIASVSAWSESVLAISTASRDCSSPRAFVGSSRSCGALESISATGHRRGRAACRAPASRT